ncbi:MAG: HpcH/HpaI aldolase family protein [Ilumatobacteraceae bacterium]
MSAPSPHASRTARISSAVAALRADLAAGRAVVGSWMQLADADLAELVGDAGYRWVGLDMEHGTIVDADLPHMCRALASAGALPLARVATPQAIHCRRALDLGAAGVIIPMVSSATQLAELVAACSWPPAGRRGVGFARANGWGADFDEYAAAAQRTFVVAQIEHVDAVGAIDEIVAVPGLDAVMVGPYDLSASLGATGRFDAPDFVAAVDRIRAAARGAGVAAGIHVVEPDEAALRARVAEGWTFVAYGVDTVFVRRAAAAPRV